MHPIGTLGQHIEFVVLRQQLDLDSGPRLCQGLSRSCFSKRLAAPWACPPDTSPADRSGASVQALFPSGCPDPSTRCARLCHIAFSILSRNSLSVVLSLVLPAKHFVGQRKALRRHDQRNDHLHTIAALVAAIAKAPLVILIGGGLDSK